MRLALDDFGNGYSSLSCLKRLPVDLVNIDRSIVAGVERDRSNYAIVLSTIQLAHALGLEVVAEGVETEGELARLRARRCDLAQGFYISRPLPEGAATRFLFGEP